MNTRTHRTKLLLPLALVLTSALHANNIQVTNTTLVENTGSTVKVQFDISWENSWRGEGVANWDAAWVFVKYKLSNGSWAHVRLSNSGHTAPAGSLLELGLLTPGIPHNTSTNPVIGTFLRRDAEGTGTFTASGVQLFWDYAAQGVIASNDIASVQVFAIEMVYVNEGPFVLGTGGSESGRFYRGGTNEPFPITSEGITLVFTPGHLWSSIEIIEGTVNAAFPKGFAASYVMKYEISQQQYVDFLNTLTRLQQNNSVADVEAEWVLNGHNGNAIYRQRVRTNSNTAQSIPVIFETDLPFVACNYLDRNRLYRYLDWAGLRPMTELEYEKACRGALPPTINEYAWGNAGLSAAANTYTIGDGGSPTESILTGYSTVGNANFTAPGGDVFLIGPFRVGIFAAHPSNNGRAAAGASYYGIMELTGNVGEQVVSIGSESGLAYTGAHGNGELDTFGAANVSDWPSGLMVRGGSFFEGPLDAGEVSRRTISGPGTGGPGRGGRGVRTAP